MSLAAIVLAAGRSQRMNSKISKILHPLGGLPLAGHIDKTLQQMKIQESLWVIPPDLHNHSFFKDKKTVIQEKPLGTGDAVACALKSLSPESTELLILCGDTPLIESHDLQPLLDSQAPLALVAMMVPTQQHAYGRLIVDSKKQVQCIREAKDLKEGEASISLANSGVYKINRKLLEEGIQSLTPNNAAKELYLTDLIAWAYEEKGCYPAYVLGNYETFQGVNTRADLAQTEKALQKRWRQKAMNSGVTLVDPQTVFFSHDTKFGRDSYIEPFVVFGPGVVLHDEVHIRSHCYLENCEIYPNCEVGPFAHLRGHTTMHEGAQIGNFVEVKGSVLGPCVKAKHLSYLGDCHIEEKSNIGAGTITCNYDGFQKSKTRIGKGVFVGSNSTLIAPLQIGEGSYIAAGTVVSGDVNPDTLAISRPPLVQKEGKAKEIRERKKHPA